MATHQPELSGLSDPAKAYTPVVGIEQAPSGLLTDNQPGLLVPFSLPVIQRPEIRHPDKSHGRSKRKN